MRFVFLIIDYVPHQVLSIKNLINNFDAEVLAFHVGRFNSYIPAYLNNFTTQNYKSLSKQEKLKAIKTFNPDVVVTAGWMIPEYNWLCRKIKQTMNIPIVAMSDTPWYGTWRQRVNAILSPFYVKKMFTHIWVAGIRQYDYARKLGFSNQQIIFNSLSADTEVFEKVNIEAKTTCYPKIFLFIGRYTEIKGLRNLIKAWSAIKDKKGWKFTLIGAGEMKDELINSGQFIVKDYMPQELLLDEMQHSGCFVLPSLHEPWALVIHEAASAGLPILCTETCGAAPHFVINGYNGYRIKDNSVEDLKLKLEKIINTDKSDLLKYSYRSRELSISINPEIQTASLMQLVYENS